MDSFFHSPAGSSIAPVLVTNRLLSMDDDEDVIAGLRELYYEVAEEDTTVQLLAPVDVERLLHDPTALAQDPDVLGWLLDGGVLRMSLQTAVAALNSDTSEAGKELLVGHLAEHHKQVLPSLIRGNPELQHPEFLTRCIPSFDPETAVLLFKEYPQLMLWGVSGNGLISHDLVRTLGLAPNRSELHEARELVGYSDKFLQELTLDYRRPVNLVGVADAAPSLVLLVFSLEELITRSEQPDLVASVLGQVNAKALPDLSGYANSKLYRTALQFAIRANRIIMGREFAASDPFASVVAEFGHIPLVCEMAAADALCSPERADALEERGHMVRSEEYQKKLLDQILSSTAPSGMPQPVPDWLISHTCKEDLPRLAEGRNPLLLERLVQHWLRRDPDVVMDLLESGPYTVWTGCVKDLSMVPDDKFEQVLEVVLDHWTNFNVDTWLRIMGAESIADPRVQSFGEVYQAIPDGAPRSDRIRTARAAL